jgi:hypothetical protein
VPALLSSSLSLLLAASSPFSFNGIIAIQVLFSSFRCTSKLYGIGEQDAPLHILFETVLINEIDPNTLHKNVQMLFFE